MVEEAVFTNSPSSFRVASSSLLVTPSRFASSCTRSFPGTCLLLVGLEGGTGNGDRPLDVDYDFHR